LAFLGFEFAQRYFVIDLPISVVFFASKKNWSQKLRSLRRSEFGSLALIAAVMAFLWCWLLCVGKRHLSGKQVCPLSE